MQEAGILLLFLVRLLVLLLFFLPLFLLLFIVVVLLLLLYPPTHPPTQQLIPTTFSSSLTEGMHTICLSHSKASRKKVYQLYLGGWMGRGVGGVSGVGGGT